MELSFENLLLIEHYIDNILSHINECIIEGKEITYIPDGFNLAYILSTYRIFNEEEHLSMMTKWKYDSNLDLESTNWLIEYYLTGKEIIKSYLEENEEVIDAEFNFKEKIENKNDIIKINSICTSMNDVLKNDYINISPDDIYIDDNNNNNNNLEIQNNNNLEIQDDNNLEIDNVDDFISAYPTKKKRGKIILK